MEIRRNWKHIKKKERGSSLEKGEKTLKQILFLKQAQIQKAIFTSVVSKGGLGLCGILLWDRVINQHSLYPYGVVETGFSSFFYALESVHGSNTFRSMDSILFRMAKQERPAQQRRKELPLAPCFLVRKNRWLLWRRAIWRKKR